MSMLTILLGTAALLAMVLIILLITMTFTAGRERNEQRQNNNSVANDAITIKEHINNSHETRRRRTRKR